MIRAQTAQECLVELEKLNAPIVEQIEQAALFCGLPIANLHVLESANDAGGYEESYGGRKSHGRQEYVLRWLMKRLQEADLRQCPEAWRLLKVLIISVPTRNVARILNERNFVVVLRQALEEAVERGSNSDHGTMKIVARDGSSDTIKANQVKKVTESRTKKRKRSRNLTNESGSASEADGRDLFLQKAIHDTINLVLQLSIPKEASVEALASEYMKSILRTTAEEATRILGSWLELCQHREAAITRGDQGLLLSPFSEIWRSRIRSGEDAEVFSKHCLRRILVLICAHEQLPDYKADLESLLARNVVIHMKAAYMSSKNGAVDLLETYVRDNVSTNPLFAPILFDVAIRCVQPHGIRPRGSEELAWLQAVFNMLNQSMATSSPDLTLIAVDQMLRASMKHRVALDLPLLQLISSQYGITANGTNWDILATIVKLDSNVFLIPQASGDLKNDLLSRITKATLDPTWLGIVDQVIDDILTPLMGKFSQARQLSLFIHHWYEQLAKLENNRQRRPDNFNSSSAWEDWALQLNLKGLMEASLTTAQIIEVLEWLEEKLTECEAAAIVLIDVVSGALSREDTIATMGPTIQRIVNNILEPFNNDKRYTPRIWRLAATSLQWLNPGDDAAPPPMDRHLASRLNYLMRPAPTNIQAFMSLEMLEACRYLCSLWDAGDLGLFKDSANSILNFLINGITSIMEELLRDVKMGSELRNDKWGGRVPALERDVGWFACAFVNCILVEHPKILEKFTEASSPTTLSLLRSIIWVASATTSDSADHSPSPWLRINHDAFPSIWNDMLRSELVLNSPKISRQVIEAMLGCRSNEDNPIDESRTCNGFVVRCFHRIPIDVLSRSDRESILKSWPLEPGAPKRRDMTAMSCQMASLDPAILSIKAKMMQRPSLYDGIQFQDLIDLGSHLISAGLEPLVLGPIFGRLAGLTLSHVFATVDQPKSGDYIRGMIVALQEWLGESCKAKKPLSYAMIRLTQESMSMMSTKALVLDSIHLISTENFQQLRESYFKTLSSNLIRHLQKPDKLGEDLDKRCLSLYSTMDALDDVLGAGIGPLDLPLDTQAIVASLKQVNGKLGQRFERFMTQSQPKAPSQMYHDLMDGDIGSTSGRQALQIKARSITDRLTESEKLRLTASLLVEGPAITQSLDKLLALKVIISTCEDLRNRKTENDEEIGPSLSSTYSSLADGLRMVKGVRQFCLMSETMEYILRNKPRSITQYNIDTTLSSITTLCTRHSPPLRTGRSGTIYMHLIRLVNAILVSHRVKLQGHFHLMVQTLVALLRCLFAPTSGSHHSQRSAPAGAARPPAPPPWLTSPTGSKSHPLTAAHATAYARLLTLLCDPSLSQISRPAATATPLLHSAAQQAKAAAGLHVPYVLMAHIRWTLDMNLSMRPDVREVLIPGWYAVLDAMGREGRRAAGESMDAGGRVVLGGLVRGWSRWGKWRG